MSSAKKKSAAPKTNTAIATEGKALIAQASTVLAAGEPLSAKARKEVIIHSIRTTPALVSAAAATYTQHEDVLGGDLDAAAALDSQDFVVQMTPVVTAVRTFAQALEDRIHEHEANASGFAATVYDRAQAMQRMPNGAVLAPRIAQLEELQVRPKKKPKAKAEEAPSSEAKESESEASSPAPAPETPSGQSPTVIVQATK